MVFLRIWKVSFILIVEDWCVVLLALIFIAKNNETFHSLFGMSSRRAMKHEKTIISISEFYKLHFYV